MVSGQVQETEGNLGVRIAAGFTTSVVLLTLTGDVSVRYLLRN